MTRTIIFRIVGFAFLAFAAVSIYQGEFGVDDSHEVVITRAHDPQSFWRGIIIQIGFGCALLYLSRSNTRAATLRADGRGESLTSLPTAEERLELPGYDPAFCRKLVKAAAYVCVGLIVAELLVLLLVHPSDDLCPGWIFHPNQRSAASMWVMAGMFTVLPALWMCNIALRWDRHYERKTYDGIVNGPPGLNANWVLLMVCAGWCLFCAIPLFMMLGQCTALSHDMNLNALHF
jgi:hypothetical protein